MIFGSPNNPSGVMGYWDKHTKHSLACETERLIQNAARTAAITGNAEEYFIFEIYFLIFI